MNAVVSGGMMRDRRRIKIRGKMSGEDVASPNVLNPIDN
jgi:hypothetical protein